MGTNWHAMHEVYANCVETFGSAEAIRMEAVVNHLNERYAAMPTGFDPVKWELERTILLTSFMGYQWYWQNDPMEFLASEVPFNLPLHLPRVNMPLPMTEVQRVGKIDHVVKWQGAVCSLERKSTTRAIGPDSDYWERSKKDTQVSMYALAFRDMIYAAQRSGNTTGLSSEIRPPSSGDRFSQQGQILSSESSKGTKPQSSLRRAADEAGESPDIIRDQTRLQQVPREEEAVSTVPPPRPTTEGVSDRHEQGTTESEHDLGRNSEVRDSLCQLSLVLARCGTTERLGSTVYDVWHKPTIKPCELTQKETAELIETGKYCGVEFAVAGDVSGVSVDGVWATVIPGKKGFAIRETIGMYSARLLGDIYERPEFYFQRREIVRTDAELAAFKIEIYSIYQAQRLFAKTGCWFSNEQQCRATFPCPYISICYGTGADSVCDGRTTPPGYKRIFVDLTVRGQPVEEEE